MKDNFSTGSDAYLRFRPDYPDEMIEYIVSFSKKGKALDVATGNGQFAAKLAKHFEVVFATDISNHQLEHAIQKENIAYKQEAAEAMSFGNNEFDLVTVAQALHWFDFTSFYSEVKRVLKNGGVFAAVGYGLLVSNEKTDAVILKYYDDILGPYWDPERRYLDENYESIPFPFVELPSKKFNLQMTWSYEQLEGYLKTWSAAKHYEKRNKTLAFELIKDELLLTWEHSNKKVTFPLLLRLGKYI